jgi:hypothetical protein
MRLESQPQQIAQPFLTHADQHAPDAHPVSDLQVDGVGLFFGHAILDVIRLTGGNLPYLSSGANT